MDMALSFKRRSQTVLSLHSFNGDSGGFKNCQCRSCSVASANPCWVYGFWFQVIINATEHDMDWKHYNTILCKVEIDLHLSQIWTISWTMWSGALICFWDFYKLMIFWTWLDTHHMCNRAIFILLKISSLISLQINLIFFVAGSQIL